MKAFNIGCYIILYHRALYKTRRRRSRIIRMQCESLVFVVYKTRARHTRLLSILSSQLTRPSVIHWSNCGWHIRKQHPKRTRIWSRNKHWYILQCFDTHNFYMAFDIFKCTRFAFVILFFPLARFLRSPALKTLIPILLLLRAFEVHF